ncbi:MAG: DUF2335 domain-containing protein [Bryobacterales bacterium]|nr:DUF2335 domain-containing protein [Bryobacterales bacterium]
MTGDEVPAEGATERDGGGELEARGQPSKPEAAEVLAVRRAAYHVQGPLPPPSVLRGYDQVVKGGVERIFAMAERQAAHRQQIESRGQIVGFSLAATSPAGAFLAVAVGVPLAGVSGVILAIATLSGFFIWGKAGRAKGIPAGRIASKDSTPRGRFDG